MVAVPNVYLALRSGALILRGEPAVDWTHFQEASQRFLSGGLYELSESYGWRYSPLAAYAFGALGILGTTGWRLLHLGAALALPGPLLIAVTLLSWPFWWDVQTGNTVVFFLLAGAWALRGSRLATAGYLIGLLLIPRPVMLPLAAWLLWKRPAWRLPFATLFVAHALAVAATGWGDEWIRELMNAKEIGSATDVGPSRILGRAWLVVGVPLGIWLTWKGRVGWASLAVSPYLLPYYLLMGLLELVPKREEATSSGQEPEAATMRYSAPPP